MERRINAHVESDRAIFKPDPAGAQKIPRFRNLRNTEQLTIKDARGGFAARWHRELNVMNFFDWHPYHLPDSSELGCVTDHSAHTFQRSVAQSQHHELIAAPYSLSRPKPNRG